MPSNGSGAWWNGTTSSPVQLARQRSWRGGASSRGRCSTWYLGSISRRSSGCRRGPGSPRRRNVIARPVRSARSGPPREPAPSGRVALDRGHELAAEIGDVLDHATPHDVPVTERGLVHPDGT